MARTTRSCLPFLILAASLGLGSCSFFGWASSVGEATVRIVAMRPSADPEGSRALSGSGGGLDIPDFTAYKLKIFAPDMDPVELSFAAGATISATIPAGASRTFDLFAYTTQARFEGTNTVAVAAGASSVSINLTMAETDLFVPAYTTIGRIVRVTYASAGAPLSIGDVKTTDLVNPVGGALSPGFDLPFSPTDTAVDAEGFLYLCSDTPETVSAARIVKIRNVNDDVNVPSEVFYAGMRGIDSPAAYGIGSIAIDRVRGIMYFCRGGEPWFYKKSLAIMDGAADQRGVVEKCSLAAGTMIALDCGPDGSVYVLRGNGASQALERYTPDSVLGVIPAPGTGLLPSPYAAAATSPANSRDVQVIGAYVYVLSSLDPMITRYDLGALVNTPLTGGASGTGAAAGVFESADRFLTGPAGAVYVRVQVGGSHGLVSFTDMSGWAGWTFRDIGVLVP